MGVAGRIALVGPAAERWGAEVPDAHRELIGPPSRAELWIVGIEDRARIVVDSSVTVLVVNPTSPAEPALDTDRLWALGSPEPGWLAALLAAVARGEPLEQALAGIGAHPVHRSARPGLDQRDDLDVDVDFDGLEGGLGGLQRLDRGDRLDLGIAPPVTAGGPPPADEPAAADAAADEVAAAEPPPQARHLVAEFWVGDRAERRALPPATAVRLGLAVKVPDPDEIHGGPPVDVPREEGRSSVVLDVTVTDTQRATTQRAELSVPTSDPSADSTWAVVDLVTPDEGGVLDLQVTLAYRGRPLQVGALAAPIRTHPLPPDRVQFTVENTTAGPLPPAHFIATNPPRSATVDALGADLVHGADRVAQTDVREILEAFELTLSRTLGSPDAPVGLATESAQQLLIRLARDGARLRRTLEPLGLAQARTLNLLIRAGAPLFPLELAYDGPPPALQGTAVCTHGPDEPCPGPTDERLCPYAFWGLSRTIARTVVLTGQEREPLERVPLAPILYASAAIADAGSTDPLPSAALFDHLRHGARLAPTRVKTWEAWSKAVAKKGPSLMVLLVHLETGGYLEIGTKSQLSDADLRASHLVGESGTHPLVVLIACATALSTDPFASLHGALIDQGAAAVVGTLGKLNGVQGARTAMAVVDALRAAAQAGTPTLGAALTHARRQLLAEGLLTGLLLVSHGEIDTPMAAHP